MKKKHIISLLPALSGIALLVWLFSGGGPRPAASTQTGKTTRSREHPHPSPETASRLEERFRMWENSAVPVDFYGKIIGPDGEGLPGVEVSWRAGLAGPRALWGPDGKVSKSGTCSTGPDGRFEVHAGRGYDFTIRSLSKPGWLWAGREEWGVLYGDAPEPHHPDPARPVEFLMVPKDAPKPKRIFARSIKFDWNGAEARFQLGEKAGTLVLSAKRRVVKPHRFHPTYEWSVDMRLEGGGLRPCESRTVLAPKDGYAKSLHFGSADGRNNSRWFVFRTDDGFYGKINLDIYPGRDKTSQCQASLYVFLNETGARNLK
jgi:hypothetical protein